MIKFLSIALFSAVSTASTADIESARVGYSNCLVDYTVEQLEMKTGTSAFKKGAKNACSEERQAMISALKKDEMEFGSSESEATSYATEEADSVLFAYTDNYAGYASSNTRPVREE